MKKHGDIAKQILLAIGITGLVLTVTVAPGAVLALKLLNIDEKEFSTKRYNKQKAARTVQRLQKSKLITVKERDGKMVVELTRKGKKKFKDIQFENLHIAKPSKWDKKWRVVIFDIPDKSFRHGRDALRSKLKEWEFYPLQKSVWICPWPCENEIQFIAELYNITPYVNIMVTERILDDVAAKKHFGL